MTKKLTLLVMAIGAVMALAVPAMASAAPSLTQPANTLVPTGTTIKGVSTNTVTQTPLGNLTCANVTVNAKLTENSGTSVMAEQLAGGATTSTCFLGTNAISITNISVPTITATSAKKTIRLSFEADLPGGLTCHYQSAGETPFTYTAGSSKLKITNGELEASPEICGEEEEVFLSGEYTLSDSGGAIILD